MKRQLLLVNGMWMAVKGNIVRWFDWRVDAIEWLEGDNENNSN